MVGDCGTFLRAHLVHAFALSFAAGPRRQAGVDQAAITAEAARRRLRAGGVPDPEVDHGIDDGGGDSWPVSARFKLAGFDGWSATFLQTRQPSSCWPAKCQ